MEIKRLIEDGYLVIKSDLIDIKIRLHELFGGLTKEEQCQVAEALTWGPILDEAINRLLGQSFCWGGGDDRLRLDVLSEMEDRLISGYHWDILRNLDDVARDMISKGHIYWKMYHEDNEDLRNIFHKWLQQHNIPSEHMAGKEVLPEYLAFKQMVEDAFKKLAQGKKEST